MKLAQMEDGKLDLNKIKELHEKGIVLESGLIRAKIINRYESMRKTTTWRKADLYYKVADEFCLSEGRVRNIVTKYYQNLRK